MNTPKYTPKAVRARDLKTRDLKTRDLKTEDLFHPSKARKSTINPPSNYIPAPSPLSSPLPKKNMTKMFYDDDLDTSAYLPGNSNLNLSSTKMAYNDDSFYGTSMNNTSNVASDMSLDVLNKSFADSTGTQPVSEIINNILEANDFSSIYHDYFQSKYEDRDIGMILTSLQDIFDNVDIDFFNFEEELSNKVFDICKQTILRDYILKVIAKDSTHSFFLIPCKKDCKTVEDFYSFLAGTVDFYQGHVHLDLICKTGPFLMTILIFITKQLNLEYITLDAVLVPEIIAFYRRYGFAETNTHVHPLSDTVRMKLDMRLYEINDNINRILTKEPPIFE